MQIVLVRHALPLHSPDGHGADPELDPVGLQMADRLPTALHRHRITEIISSPQLRARQTAEPLAQSVGRPAVIDDRFAEYDLDFASYVPVEKMGVEGKTVLQRFAADLFPVGVDVDGFRSRVLSAWAELVEGAKPDACVAVVCHGGVISVILQSVLQTPRVFPFTLDYVSLTQIHYGKDGTPTVAGVNAIDHVWDLLPKYRQRHPIISE